MIHTYASDPKNILATVQVASVDRAASLGVNIALTYDREGKRTIRFLTKVDTL